MGNKVLMAYVVADVLFVITGAVMLAFSIIVQNSMFSVPTDGNEAARNLIYQSFPLTGKDGWKERSNSVVEVNLG